MQQHDAHGLEPIVEALARSVDALPEVHRIGRGEVPELAELERALEVFRSICFPGFFGARSGGDRDAHAFLGVAVSQLHAALVPQFERAVRAASAETADAHGLAQGWFATVLAETPRIRELLAADAREALAADPAARSLDEIILCYPGLHAMVTHRFAHALHGLGVPLVPRMLAEIAHRRTGIDIHPGARIGPGLFIDHGTGVVIGETTVIGRQCRIYQGVTLGALTPELDRGGRVERGQKRHPTLGDRVVVYAGATILGGDTVIGDGAT
ncbi:MAG: serine O-acetyltransferase, partial [Planctomycetota bacterium]